MTETQFLTGQFLIAMPTITDKRFERAVIYICSHNLDGAMGIVINHLAPQSHFINLIDQLNITPKLHIDDLSEKLRILEIYRGGPVDANRGFVLHSPDYNHGRATQKIDDYICLTATIDVIKALAGGEGPKDVLFSLGCSSWTAGQLEREIQNNGWLFGQANMDIIFRTEPHLRYEKALLEIGIGPSNLASLSSVTGRA